jgi:hypothetical protein
MNEKGLKIKLLKQNQLIVFESKSQLGKVINQRPIKISCDKATTESSIRYLDDFLNGILNFKIKFKKMLNTKFTFLKV